MQTARMQRTTAPGSGCRQRAPAQRRACTVRASLAQAPEAAAQHQATDTLRKLRLITGRVPGLGGPACPPVGVAGARADRGGFRLPRQAASWRACWDLLCDSTDGALITSSPDPRAAAIKTPYLQNGKFDLDAFDAMVEQQIANGVEVRPRGGGAAGRETARSWACRQGKGAAAGGELAAQEQEAAGGHRRQAAAGGGRRRGGPRLPLLNSPSGSAKPLVDSRAKRQSRAGPAKRRAIILSPAEAFCPVRCAAMLTRPPARSPVHPPAAAGADHRRDHWGGPPHVLGRAHHAHRAHREPVGWRASSFFPVHFASLLSSYSGLILVRCPLGAAQ